MEKDDPGNIADMSATNPNTIVELTSPEVGQDNFISKRTVLSSANPNITAANALDNWSTMGVGNLSTIVEVRSADRVPIEVRNYSVDGLPTTRRRSLAPNPDSRRGCRQPRTGEEKAVKLTREQGKSRILKRALLCSFLLHGLVTDKQNQSQAQGVRQSENFAQKRCYRAGNDLDREG